MSYENKRDKLKKKLRANRPKINGKKYFSEKATKREHQAEMKKYKELYRWGGFMNDKKSIYVLYDELGRTKLGIDELLVKTATKNQ